MYVQRNDVAMDSPLAPVIAGIFMAHEETTLIDRLMEIGVCVCVCEWHRYVDGTFVLIEAITNVSDVLHILNNFHPSIKFTHEVKADQSLPFIDVKVGRSSERQIFEKTNHRKPTYIGLLTRFVPLSYKRPALMV
jgi:hypothetical protein